MSVISAVQNRRSIRKYKNKPVDSTVLADILEAGRLAPSWKNQQCFTYILVEDRELIAALGEINDYNPTENAYQNAAYFIALCADPLSSGRSDDKEYYMADAALSIQQMMLVATDNDIGMCWIGAFYESPVKKLLNIPDELKVVALSPIGIPDEHPDRRPRRELSEMVYYNKYGFDYRPQAVEEPDKE